MVHLFPPPPSRTEFKMILFSQVMSLALEIILRRLKRSWKESVQHPWFASSALHTAAVYLVIKPSRAGQLRHRPLPEQHLGHGQKVSGTKQQDSSLSCPVLTCQNCSGQRCSVGKSCQEVPGFASGQLVQLCVFLGPVHSAKLLHVLLDVLLGLVFDVLIAFKVFGVLARLQFLVHHTMSQL